ncbi:hypothetical protein C9374_006565 [Naegleria lovaniensis]|uniref:Uncharacterized protein n=1 Tax=Naegleria lovaniensis TaxID=51637 RepID=A0AA88GNB3_NAELO|nr:uncharacterized protein C9374_006565 [Naegleria lovaniensis]KAG2379448.1 hypothetical protein C9374_006565 [Naegleria lovaniensis]
MYKCVKKGSCMIWNAELTKAREYLSPHIDTLPRFAFEFASIDAYIAGISGERQECHSAFENLEKAEQCLANCYRKEDVLKMIESIKKMNEECDKELSSSNKQWLYDSCDKCHPNYVELKEMTAEQQLFNFELDLKLVNAENHFLRGLLQFLNGSYFKGFYNFRKSYLKYKEVYNQVESLKNETKQSSQFVHSDVLIGSYLGIGVFNFLISVLPPTLAKILSVLGFDADRELGLSLMHKTHDYAGLHLGPASFMLCINYLFIPRAFEERSINLNRVKPILEHVTHVYSESGFFKFIQSHYEMKCGNMELALQHMTQCVNIMKRETGSTPNQHLFEKSNMLMLSCQFEKAHIQLEEMLSNTSRQFDSKGNCAFFLIVCKIFLGDEKGALDMMNGKNGMPPLETYMTSSNKFAKEKLELLKHVKSDRTKLLIPILFFFQLAYLKRDLANLKPQYLKPLHDLFMKHFCNCNQPHELLEPKVFSEEEEQSKVYGDLCAGYCVIHAQTLNVLGQNEQAMKLFKKALSYENKIKYEKQWIAFSYYELAEYLYLHGEKQKKNQMKGGQDLKVQQCQEQVKEYLTQCNKMSGFPFEEILHTRSKLALKQIDQEMNKV